MTTLLLIASIAAILIAYGLYTLIASMFYAQQPVEAIVAHSTANDRMVASTHYCSTCGIRHGDTCVNSMWEGRR